MTDSKKSEAAKRSVQTRRVLQAKREAEFEEWAKQWCPKDHRTWNSKVRCMWGRGWAVVGEGPHVAWHPDWGREVRLGRTPGDATGGYPGAKVWRIRRGLHKRKGKASD